jgi:hypothetical protein
LQDFTSAGTSWGGIATDAAEQKARIKQTIAKARIFGMMRLSLIEQAHG